MTTMALATPELLSPGPPHTVQAPATVRRGFADVAEGQVHFREAGRRSRARRPLVMLHASPGSARMLEPLVAQLGRHRHVIATDTLGNGDSSAPRLPAEGGMPSIAYFADAHVRALDALGIAAFDLYGSHTGANIACEIAIAHPQRVGRLVLDGVSLYSAEEREDMLKHYAPGVKIDQAGSQLHWIWNFVRDVYLFWPWYRRDAAHARSVGLPPADELHDKVVEVLKATRTYHYAYRSAIGYDKAPRLPLVRVPTLLACGAGDMLLAYFERVQALMPDARPLITRGTATPDALAETARHFEAFLNQTSP
ncbi:Haloacetate dehalogenase H-1 (plasmid) [Variovorax sp. SRS16]|uniref:alpha/beta fold hydrolase n=1 Tax=Variovorax sp. SRS16 TaxID=282217 RepID=UPI0013169AB9|nr:alpha/beta fold hydrolase [Variovorax sp. SRS16]VTU46609.1 Haloacetate dehalogenase H-1 [Variovorax sp. SRS16]